MSLSNYPENFDTNQNLYLVHDYLRLKLAEDYTPGDYRIYVTGNKSVMSSFPNAIQGGGVITLIDQCDEVQNRAISFRYTARTTNDLLDTVNPWYFEGIEILENFNDVKKYKNATSVCQNVIAEHHNSLKDALINIQNFAGIKDKVGTVPYQGTMEERINYLRKIVLGPRAWFSSNKNISSSPGKIVFNDLSFSLGTDGLSKKSKYTWYFDLNKISSGYSPNPDTQSKAILVYEKISTEEKDVIYTYDTPGNYTVGLLVENEFGSDFVVFENMINIRGKAPTEATISIQNSTNQITYNGSIRSTVGNVISVDVSSPGIIEDNKDSISSYTWNIVDDLNHFNNSSTKCSFSVGGIYDIGLRVDTKFGNFRITIFEDKLDIVEKTNLWLWNINSNKDSIINYEFGLISETFKTHFNYLIPKIDNSFIKNKCTDSSYSYDNSIGKNCRELREFDRNNGFSKRNSTSSGDLGKSLLYWSSGRSDVSHPSTEKIYFREFFGFEQSYKTVSINGNSHINRPWNWVDLVSDYNIYFCFGKSLFDTSGTNKTLVRLNLNSLSKNEYEISQYSNGAEELTINTICQGWKTNDLVAAEGGCSDPQVNYVDYYTSQRSAWKDGSGYILRNEGAGDYIRFRPFYKTSGVTSNEVTSIKKISDLTGPVKSEGQFVTLSDGIFLFNNTGSISVHNTITGVWATGGPGTNSSEFRFLQDVNKQYFDNQGQSLLATSDNDQVAYLSYDYSEKSFIKFNNVDLTFKYIGSRPSGDQWQFRCH
jgi:hypothetical protein